MKKFIAVELVGLAGFTFGVWGGSVEKKVDDAAREGDVSVNYEKRLLCYR